MRRLAQLGACRENGGQERPLKADWSNATGRPSVVRPRFLRAAQHGWLMHRSQTVEVSRLRVNLPVEESLSSPALSHDTGNGLPARTPPSVPHARGGAAEGGVRGVGSLKAGR